MSKVSGTYPSISRGVNQQPFEARLDGQHGEQVNMWSDPVHGLSRRRGTVLQGAAVDNTFGPSYHQLSAEQQLQAREFWASYRTVPYTDGAMELMVHYPTKPKPLWMLGTPGPQGGIKVSRKIQNAGTFDPGASIEPLGTNTAVDQGVAAVAQAGRYLFLYTNNTPFVAPAEVDAWAASTNGAIALEIKQGIPNRLYTVYAWIDGVLRSWPYTTPSSTYSGTLSTTDIPFDAPDYAKQVNDRVNAYNSAVTAWITLAAQQTRPAYIAAQLASLMTPQVVAGGGFMRTDVGTGSFLIECDPSRINRAGLEDSGNGEAVAVCEKTVTDVSKLSRFHKNGKIVQVKPQRGEESFYLKAVSTAADTWGPVRWEECPRTTQAPITNPMLVMACNAASATAFKVGLAPATPAGLASLGTIIGDASVTTLPGVNGRLVGDADSNPTPAFFGKQVTWMGMFQDRLCVAAGNVINMSEVGNYLNFWRTQTLTVPDSDAVEIYALGSEADTIRASVIFDRSLLLFGDNQQYSIDGRNPVTPSTGALIQSSSIEDAVACQPVVGGSFVFFGKKREGSAEVFQMEVGDVQDTSAFTGLGMQLSDYLPGAPSQILYVASPLTLFVRTSEAPHSVFVFRFIDQNRQRLLDSWSRFDYGPAFGLILGMFYHDGAVYLRGQREAIVVGGQVQTGAGGGYGYDALDRQSLLPQVPGLPYLDSMRPVNRAWTSGLDWYGRAYSFLATVLTKDKVDNRGGAVAPAQNPWWLHGTQPSLVSPVEWDNAFGDIPGRSLDYAVTGLPFSSYVDLTSPVRRDPSGQPIMQGRLTVNRLELYYRDSSGFTSTVLPSYEGTAPTYSNNGRVVGAVSNVVGQVPVIKGAGTVTIGREAKEYVCRIAARTWLPLNLTRVTWTGQWFLNHRFV